ncbi:kynurenine 3-monooxygenase [Cryptococcus neoformans C23]|uniref:Kynurenine 3-monooxygenase n=2 Tax=Cryptococcus neoformans TaxID=5207 RepID=A0A854Q9Y1_CRYNE|nr:kynurenine 3-monooxygenase [Cryptococcus neoformans var. grubii H99]AUB26754.1 kynurenine 3-monooxygenase [Cryptococcus neoformans var. grubii]OWZ29887.1 kynurenine 3-monooxygenase [Cryptococcus neoformans var. grubii AD2-60a]OWZ41761.1 kynurenine 3-monooxygenase [Cryptococcus neoformans var. grubii C23]OXC83151.1 kynurenine 3-monooxygenase [Cryptococcus neoformans var. grubii AD1-7a]OXG16765.1 kynurenine 3-monooxygenase [Cryptococcus neoformans var. grubii Tu259-1]OXG36083.1 kynurenine 3-|eukprot:XP_012051342.1 kynurenine 3-monooxygenase [Cryptococcus neoformans var. grubii H99]
MAQQRPKVPSHVLILGGGLAGTCFALALSKSGIRSTIFELRSDPGDIGGALMLAPNALRVLDKLVGIYEEIKDCGFNFEKINFYSEDGMKLGGFAQGDQDRWGYKAIRIKRPILHKKLLEACAASDRIDFKYGMIWKSIDENETGVTIHFEDGTRASGDILIGCDGIHSRLRSYLLPDPPTPTYAGLAGIGGEVPRSSLDIPPYITLPAFIYTRPGMVMFVPCDSSGETIGWAAQRTVPERTRAGWREYEESGDAIRRIKEDYKDVQNETLQSLLKVASEKPGEGRVWAPYQIPHLPTWHSKRICLIGDAAHAIPPSGGQGAAQAFEDGGLLSMFLSNEEAVGKGYEKLFEQFEKKRKKRFEIVESLTKTSGNSRQEGTTGLEWFIKKWGMWAYLSTKGGYMKDDALMSYDVTKESVAVPS